MTATFRKEHCKSAGHYIHVLAALGFLFYAVFIPLHFYSSAHIDGKADGFSQVEVSQEDWHHEQHESHNDAEHHAHHVADHKVSVTVAKELAAVSGALAILPTAIVEPSFDEHTRVVLPHIGEPPRPKDQAALSAWNTRAPPVPA